MKRSFLIIIALLSAAVFAGPVSNFGMLKVCKVGNKGQLCGEKTGTSTPIFVKGPSLYWSTGNRSTFYNSETVDWFVDNMQIGIIRAAMGIQYWGEGTSTLEDNPKGYYYDKAGQKAIIKRIVDAAIANDIYVIVDWHSHNAESETSLATEFFREMATEYKDVPNIIWEVYNEPVGTSSPQDSKYTSIDTYAKSVYNAIRGAGNNNLVLIGSPYYSQYPAGQASKYGTSDKAVSDNVAFTFHFYAGSHFKDGNIWSSSNSARNSGYAIFGSEWGFTNADGSGTVVAASDWTNFMDTSKTSNCNWSVSAFETSSMFSSGTTPSNMSTNSLSTSGNNFKNYMGNGNNWTDQIPSTHPKCADVVTEVNDGSSVSLSSTNLGLTGTVSDVSQPDNGEATYTANSVTYTTSSRGSPNAKERFIYKVTQNNVTVQCRVIVNIKNNRPVLPEIATTSVSRKAATEFDIVGNFRVSDPVNGAGAQFTQTSILPASVGTVSYTSGTITFTPSESMHNAEPTEATLSYAVRSGTNNSLTNSASVVLRIENQAPTIRAATANVVFTNMSNTEPVGLGMSRFNGKDPDGDSIWFERVYLDPQYPGELVQVKPDSFVYNPAQNRTGQVVFLAIITDGSLNSTVGKAQINLTGNGEAIVATHPTEIPGVSPIISQPVNIGGGLGLEYIGFGNVAVHFSQNGYAKLDIYSLSGKNMGTLLNGWQNAGSSEISLKNFGLQKGIYILRLRQDSQIKTLRIVN